MWTVFSNPTLAPRTLWRRVELKARHLALRLQSYQRLFRPAADLERTDALSERATALLANIGEIFSFGSSERSREILKIIEECGLTSFLSEAYFENLRELLSRKQELAAPGNLVIGLSPGRSGSTTLAAHLASLHGSCSTHENAPLVFWLPEAEQVAFHLHRFSILLRYYPIVSDTAHWWINLTDEIVSEFPSVKFIGLVRDKRECAASFMGVKGFGKGSYNHWVRHPNEIWRPAAWDRTYPTYESPDWAPRDPDRAKWSMIMTYLDSYEARLAAVRSGHTKRYLHLKTELLSTPDTLNRLNNFLERKEPMATRLPKLNKRSITDGRRDEFKL